MSQRLIDISLITKINRCSKFPTHVCNNLRNSTRYFSRNVPSDGSRQKTVQPVNFPLHVFGTPYTANRITNRIQINPVLQCSRSKHTKSNKTTQNKDDDEEEEEYYDTSQDESDNLGKQVSVYVTSLRLDAVLKAGFGLSRNKVEDYFYQSRIRVNDEKVMKKSIQVTLGDSVDIVRGINSNSDRYIDVMRLYIAGIRLPKDTQSRLELKVKRDKLLTIENYKKAWSGEDISL